MPKMQENTFGGRTPPGPVGGAYAVLQTGLRTSNGGLLLRGTEEREKRGKEREGRSTGRGGEGLLIRISHYFSPLGL